MAVVVVVLVVVAVVLAEVGVSGVMRSDECVVGGLKPQTLNLRPIAVTQELQLILVPFIEATTETIDELLAMVLVYMGQQQLLLLLLLLLLTTTTTMLPLLQLFLLPPLGCQQESQCCKHATATSGGSQVRC